jgi:hypothetical protein
MTATQQNFTVTAGDSMTLLFTITDSSTKAAVDLSGAAITWALGITVKATPIVTKTVGSGITITDAANGKLSVALVPTDTAKLAGRFYHEVQITDVIGDVSTVANGTATINPGLIA